MRPAAALVATLVLAGVVAFGRATPTWGQDAASEEPADLSQARQALEERRQTRAEAEGRAQQLDKALSEHRQRLNALRQERIAAAEAIQAHEAELTQLEERLAALRERAQRAREKMLSRQDDVQKLLMALQRLARTPDAGLLAGPDGPLATVRGARLLRSALPRLEKQADRLARDLDELADLNARVAERRRAVAQKQASLETRRQELAELTAQREELVAETAEKRERLRSKAAQAAAEAADLASLIERFERARRRQTVNRTAELHAAYRRRQADDWAPLRVPVAPKGPRYTQDPRADLRAPVAGKIIRGFGTAQGYATVSDGVTFAARSEAQVVAPLDGQVIFVGPFEGYGKILILENGGGYTTVLGGLEQVNVGVDDYVLGGEPIGRARTSQGGETTVYLELRADGEPVDPRPETETRASLDSDTP